MSCIANVPLSYPTNTIINLNDYKNCNLNNIPSTITIQTIKNINNTIQYYSITFDNDYNQSFTLSPEENGKWITSVNSGSNVTAQIKNQNIKSQTVNILATTLKNQYNYDIIMNIPHSVTVNFLSNNQSELSIKDEIVVVSDTPYYYTWWFWLIIAILIILAIIALFYIFRRPLF